MFTIKNHAGKVGAMGALGVGVLALAVAGSTVAVADPGGSNPAGGTFPAAAAGDYVAVGSDTVQDVYNAFQTGFSIDSYNAFPQPGTITIDGLTFGRPHGSGDGVQALSASLNPASNKYVNSDGTYFLRQGPDATVDIARSSSRPGTPIVTFTDANAKLAYIPLARDAVSVAIQGSSSTPSITNLTTGSLTAIYDSSTTAYDKAPTGLSAGDVQNVGTQVQVYTGTAWINVFPLLPQTSSGTRTFFQTAIGVTNANLGSWVSAGFPDNNAGTAVFPATGGAGRLIPFSAAQWIAQRNGLASTFVGFTQANISLSSINGSAPTAGTAPSLTPGALYGTAGIVPTPALGNFNRDVFSVVPKTAVQGNNATTNAFEAKATATPLGTLVSTTLPASALVGTYGFLAIGYSATTANWVYANYTNPAL